MSSEGLSRDKLLRFVELKVLRIWELVLRCSCSECETLFGPVCAVKDPLKSGSPQPLPKLVLRKHIVSSVFMFDHIVLYSIRRLLVILLRDFPETPKP